MDEKEKNNFGAVDLPGYFVGNWMWNDRRGLNGLFFNNNGGRSGAYYINFRSYRVGKGFFGSGSHELILNHVDVKIYEGDFTIIMGHLVRENRHCCMHSVVWIGLQVERLHIVEKRLVIITKSRWQSCDQNTLVSYFNKHIWSAI